MNEDELIVKSKIIKLSYEVLVNLKCLLPDVVIVEPLFRGSNGSKCHGDDIHQSFPTVALIEKMFSIKA